MKLSNRKVTIIVALITIALTGLVVLQTILLKTALKAEEETFRSNIISALNDVAKELTSSEARNAIIQISIDDSTFAGTKNIVRAGIAGDTTCDSIFVFHNLIKPQKVVNELNSEKYKFVIEAYTDDNYILLDSATSQIEVGMVIHDSLVTHDDHNRLDFFKSSHTFTTGNHLNRDSARFMLIETALSQLENMELIPIENRVDTLTLDSAIQDAFQRVNVDLDYSFAVTNFRADSLLLSSRQPTLEQISDSPYRTVLFPYDILMTSNYLVVDFPNKQFYIYSQLMSLIIPTILFLLLIISCFIYSINLILKQRRTSTRLTDFINNMTHEFKTPISTIQLASEAISKNEVLSDKEKLHKFNNMILFENKRMKNQVDKILQIATLEEGDYILNSESLDVHKLLDEIVESFSISVKQANGTIKVSLDAVHTTIDGDRVHVLNIIYNLLDNALKYSKDNPEITISTKNIDSRFELAIKDNGIGIHSDDFKLVFNKYYRVTSGNIHDIKGFGLGLSYVKMMVEAHNGSVKLVSALDKGTEVTISLPLESK